MILGLIPARGGSKGIPRKNLYPVLGKPLVQWTIEAAQGSRLLDRLMVSTEDDEIAGICRNLGADILVRPPELASDTATGAAVLQDAAVRLPAFDVIVFLQPTSPIRDGTLIDDCITTFGNVGCDTLATGFMSFHYAYGTMGNIPRQVMGGFFYDDGNVYVHKRDHLVKGEWWGPIRHEMTIPHYYNLEIDALSDVWAAEGILRQLGKGPVGW